MHLLLQKKLCENVNKTELMRNLLRALNGKKASTRREFHYFKHRTKSDLFTFVGSFAVSQKMFENIGLMTKDYPECIPNDDAMRVRDIYFKTLEEILLNQCDVSYASIFANFNSQCT